MLSLPKKIIIHLRLDERLYLAVVLVILILFQAFSLRAETDRLIKPFYIYLDKDSPNNFFFPTGWMGDTESLEFKDDWLVNPHSGESCIRIIYTPEIGELKWAGIYWQNPANNWGFKEGSLDLTGARCLTFWARGERGGEKIEKFRVGGILGDYPDSDVANISPVVLGREWRKYNINLIGKDLSFISGGFCLVVSAKDNPQGAIFYLDNIKFE